MMRFLAGSVIVAVPARAVVPNSRSRNVTVRCVPLSTVEHRLRAARKVLRGWLADEGGTRR